MQAKAREPFRTDRKYNPEQRTQWAYNITLAERDEILAAQGGACAICRTTEPEGQGGWHVDHDHRCCPGSRSCGKCIRGLLCSRCNPMIGMARDDRDVLRAAVEYLEVAKMVRV